MKNIMRTLVAVMLTTLVAKVLVEGVQTLPKYCRRRGTTALGKAKCCGVHFGRAYCFASQPVLAKFEDIYIVKCDVVMENV